MNTQGPILVYDLQNGRLQRRSVAIDRLTDCAAQITPGVYTVARTYHRDRVLYFERHYARLVESARLLGVPFALEQAHLRALLRQCIAEAGFAETRFCVALPYITLEPLQPVPAALRQHGAAAHTLDLHRQLPRAKSTEWIGIRQEAWHSLPDDVDGGAIYEGLLLGPGQVILEGTGSNFYAVIGGKLYTAEVGVLNGISRQVLLKVAPDILPVEPCPVTLADLPRLDEAFITSSSRHVVPITEIDRQPIGGGQPGPYTHKLGAAYDAWAESHLEPL